LNNEQFKKLPVVLETSSAAFRASDAETLFKR